MNTYVNNIDDLIKKGFILSHDKNEYFYFTNNDYSICVDAKTGRLTIDKEELDGTFTQNDFILVISLGVILK